MEMTAKLSKKRVLAVYPEARYTDSGLGTGVIQADNGIIGESMINTEREGAEDAAWIDAASLLPEEKEPAPKEGERERPHQADCICRRCEDWDDAHEPAKVEAGDALPPIEITDADMVRWQRYNDEDDPTHEAYIEFHVRNRQLKESIDNYQTLLDDAVDMREQLKASLLREKGKDEEIERLRGLLREIQGQIEERPWRYCGTYQSKSIVISEDQLARIKAAVTGEQP